MTSKQSSGSKLTKRPNRTTSMGKPRSFGEQWTSKGDAFTRSISKSGQSTKTAKPKRTS